jgi:peptidoglycan/LPS O-acetylase OafA/YrhL
MKSFGKVFDECKGFGPGFPFLRIFLAFAVFLIHAFTVTNCYYFPADSRWWLLHDAVVPMFFAIAGFLVTASAYRLQPKDFFVNRVLRIVPALAMDTFVCAFLIGPVFTTVPTRQYFHDRRFFSFFLNIVGWIHYSLPGVFEHLPVARVNGSLWSVPFELLGYGIVLWASITGKLKNRLLILALVSSYMVFAVVVHGFDLPAHVGNAALGTALDVLFLKHQSDALSGFFVAVVFYQYRDRIPYDRRIAAVCAALILGMSLFLSRTDWEPLLRLLWMPAAVYLTVFLGLTQIWLPKFLHATDYSYGVYLYHQPFMESAVTLFPRIALAAPFGWLPVSLFALPLVAGTSWLSWHLVEKPALGLRKRGLNPGLEQNGRVDSASPRHFNQPADHELVMNTETNVC